MAIILHNTTHKGDGIVLYRALGFMSGTSLDGVDAALIETDGKDYVRPLAFAYAPYALDLKEALRACLQTRNATPRISRALTKAHLDVFKTFKESIDIIGFHGQTLYHNAQEGITKQMGDPAWLARVTDCPVVARFRHADIKAGGQGAPLIPLYHKALCAPLPKPLAILNLGGVGNLTYLAQTSILAFDTGPGGALLDDFMRNETGRPYDEDGILAASGTADEGLLARWLSHPYFLKQPPKSLDRNDFSFCLQDVASLSTQDGAATLAAFTARAAQHWPLPPCPLYVTGGGRKNAHIMALLNARPVEDLGWDGDALEAQGFAYLAVRSLLGLPLTLPTTTGAPRLLTGGRLYRPLAL